MRMQFEKEYGEFLQARRDFPQSRAAAHMQGCNFQQARRDFPQSQAAAHMQGRKFQQA